MNSKGKGMRSPSLFFDTSRTLVQNGDDIALRESPSLLLVQACPLGWLLQIIA